MPGYDPLAFGRTRAGARRRGSTTALTRSLEGCAVLAPENLIGRFLNLRWNIPPRGPLPRTVTGVAAPYPLEHQMSKRSPTTASKRTGTPKTAAKAQRAKPAVVRSPKPGAERVARATPSKSPSSGDNSPKRTDRVVDPSATLQAAPRVEVAAAASQAARAENPAAALHYERKASVTNGAAGKGFDFFAGAANLQAYQGGFLDMALANMQFAFDFAQRLATVRSPLDIFGVTAEFTGKRIALFQKYA
jgi:hypothetical protein